MSDWDKPGLMDRFRELVVHSELSYAQVAAALNGEFETSFSRCACLGKAYRSGIFIPVSKRQRLQGNASRVRPRRHPRPPRTIRPRKSLVELFGVVSDGVKDLQPDQSPFAVSLYDARDGQCRWPVTPLQDGLFMFCGDVTVPKYPYCTRHCLRAYNIPKSEIERLSRAA